MVSTVVADIEVECVRAIVSAVPDPEIPVITIADLGVLRGVERRGDAIVVTLTPTYTGCPATLAIRMDVETALTIAGFSQARIETVLAPAWSTDDITEAGRAKLHAYGIAPPRRGGTGVGQPPDEAIACPRCGSTSSERVSEFGSTPCKALWRCQSCREPFDVFKCL
jgi:ring-1,2-phenylacetyl-CoA epoxidase subunit PaaD